MLRDQYWIYFEWDGGEVKGWNTTTGKDYKESYKTICKYREDAWKHNHKIVKEEICDMLTLERVYLNE